MAATFEQPMTSVLLDFGRMYRWENRTMFTPQHAPVGSRAVNAQHLDALADYVGAYVNATAPTAIGKPVLQLYMLNGPDARGKRYLDPTTPIAYPMPPADFNAAIAANATVRGEIASYVRGLVSTLSPFASALEIRLTGQLEDNMDRLAALALQDVVVRLGGWPWLYGRNVCPGCAGGEVASDDSRVGTFWERHINSLAQVDPFAAEHQPGDNLSNDGWMGTIPPANISYLSQVAQEHSLYHHYWEDSIQGYTFPPRADGRPTLKFRVPPSELAAQMCQGAAHVVPQSCGSA